MRRNFLSIFLGIFLLTILGASNVFAQNAPTFNIDFTIQLRNNVSAKMGAVVVVNPASPKTGSTILVLNGTGQTANTFQPLANALFADKTGKKVARMVLLNYPGHGNSGLPISDTVKFGDLGIADYVTSLIASLDKLASIQMAPDIVMGHSLGAEIIQLAQQRLISQNTSLRTRFGVKGAIFLVPDLAGPLPWAFVDSGAAGPVVGPLVRQDPVLGNILDIPAPVWVALFYSNRSGQIIPTATKPEDALANGFISVDSATVGSDLIGASGARPAITEGIFNNSRGTVTGLITFEQDGLYLFPNEHQALYNFITQDQAGKLFFTIQGADTIHNLHVIRPSALLPSIGKILKATKKSN